MFYVYRFLNSKGVIIYVGKTNNLKNRMGQHFGNKGHLSKEVYKEVEVVEYIVESSRADMDIKELYYINKWKPKYNIKNKQLEQLTLKLDTAADKWLDVEEIYTGDQVKYLERKVKGLEHEINSQKKKIQFYEAKFEEYKKLEEKVKEQDKEITMLRNSIQFDVSKLDFSNNNPDLFSFEEVETLLTEGLNANFICNIVSSGEIVGKYVVFQENNNVFCKDLNKNILVPLSIDFFKYGTDNLFHITLLKIMKFKIEDGKYLTAKNMLVDIKHKRELERKKKEKFRKLVSREQMDRIFDIEGSFSDFEDFLWNAKDDKEVDTIIEEWIISKSNI